MKRTGTNSANILAVILNFIGLCLTGCSENPPQNLTPSVNNASSISASAPVVPERDSADAAVRRVLAGLHGRQALAIWEFLPPSYQNDMQQTVRDIAARLDDRAWQSLVATWQRARNILPGKLDAVATGATSGSESAKPLTINSSGVLRLLNAIGESELSSVEKLRTIELANFIDKTGHDILTGFGEWTARGVDVGDPFENLTKVKVELLSESGDSAVVKVCWPGQPATEHPFVRIENHWLPKTLADGWQDGIQQARAKAIMWAESIQAQPDNWQSKLIALNRVLDELEKAKSFEEIQLAWQCAARELNLAMQQTSADSPTGSSNVGKPTRVKKPDTEELLPDQQ